MAIVFLVTLAISIVGLIVLLILKRYELRTGRRVFRGMRPLLDRFFHRGLVWVEYVVPDVVEVSLKRAGYAVVLLVRRTVVDILSFFKEWLEMVLDRLRENRAPHANKEASNFLREVADHKRSVLKDAPSDRTIFDE